MQPFLTMLFTTNSSRSPARYQYIFFNLTIILSNHQQCPVSLQQILTKKDVKIEVTSTPCSFHGNIRPNYTFTFNQINSVNTKYLTSTHRRQWHKEEEKLSAFLHSNQHPGCFCYLTKFRLTCGSAFQILFLHYTQIYLGHPFLKARPFVHSLDYVSRFRLRSIDSLSSILSIPVFTVLYFFSTLFNVPKDKVFLLVGLCRLLI